MSNWKLKATAIAAAVVVLSSTTSLAFASAPSTIKHVSVKSALRMPTMKPQGIHTPASSGAHVAGDSQNILLNADLEIYAIQPGQQFETIAAEGRLKLTKVKGSTYVGTFVDNIGARSYKATATNVSLTDETGNYTITTRNGTFTFTTTSGNTGTAPKKYGKGASSGMYAAPHLFTKNTGIDFAVSQFSVGGDSIKPADGTLTFTTDALGFIVPESAKRGVVGNYSYTQGGHHKVAHIRAWGVYGTYGGNPDFLILAFKLDGRTMHFVSNEQNQPNDTTSLYGVGTGGREGQFTYVNFVLTIPAPVTPPND